MINNPSLVMRCPHCQTELSNKEAITILNGSGWVRNVRVRTPDGKIHVMDAGSVNPNTVEVLNDR